jgi:hypothetical protein
MEPSGSPIQRAARYRESAERLRRIAEDQPSDLKRRRFTDLAEQYERLASSLEDGEQSMRSMPS